MADAILTGILLPTLVAYLSDFSKFITQPSVQTGSIQVTVILVLIFAVFGLTLIIIVKWWVNRPKKETTIAIHRQEHHLHSHSKFFANARELQIVGITLQELQQIKSTLLELLQTGCLIKVLICDPDPENKLIEEIDKIVESKETRSKIKSTLAMLDDIQKDKSLSGLQANNLKVKKHKHIPTHTLLIKDPNTDSGVMQVEPYPYGIDREKRRVFILKKKKHEGLFDIYVKSYDNIWKNE
jgi:hypothetical protein